MTLSRQLIAIILALFIVAYVGTLLISVNNMRVYLMEQMQSHSKDTATSLALSLVPALSEQDWVTVNSMVDAIFDSGYYRDLVIRSTDNKIILERRLPVRIETVPPWFVRLISIETPSGEAVLSAGWSRLGTLSIRSHPGYAYHELWKSAVGTFGWFSLTWAVAILSLVILLRYILRPLHAIEQQALAISNREFPILEKLPRTRELRSVVVAMNKLSSKMNNFITDQMLLSKSIHQEAYRDPVTGLANKRHFEQRLKYLVSNPDEFPQGAIFLIQLAGFKAYNDKYGYTAGDEYLKTAARLLEQACGKEGTAVVSRLSGADFGITAIGLSRGSVESMSETLISSLSKLRTQGLVETMLIGHIGVAYYETAMSMSDLMSQADSALRTAQSKGPDTWHLYDSSMGPAVHGRMKMREKLGTALSAGQIKVLFQPVKSCSSDAILHHEVFSRILGDDGALLPATMFLPIAEQSGLSIDFDKLVIEKVRSILQATPESRNILAVNISAASVHDPGFTDWLCGLLQNSPDVGKKILFESGEFGCLAKPEALRLFVNRIRAAGGRFSLDHFGLGFGSFKYLREMALDYIKIDGSFIRNLDTNQDNQFFVHSLAGIAHGLDIQVIAESVETQQEWDALSGLHVDGAQGYFLGKPQERM